MKNKAYYNIIAVFLLALFAGMAVSSIWPDRKSPTCDELAHHIPVGYVLLSKGDLKMDTSHPPLSRYLVGLPLRVFMDINMPDDKSVWRVEDRSVFGKDFFYKYDNDPGKILFASRMAVLFVAILGAIGLFLWARSLYGIRCALMALFLYCLSPNIIAHSRLATTDMVSTVTLLLSLYCFWIFVNKPTLATTLISGFTLGLAQLSKYSSLILYPVLLVLLLFELPSHEDKTSKNRILRAFIAIVMISLVTLWAGYGFEFKPILQDAMRVEEKLRMVESMIGTMVPFMGQSFKDGVRAFLLETPVPLGSHILGILGVLRHGYEGHGTFFMGKWSSHGNPLYFIVAMGVKTPIASLILILSGLSMYITRPFGRNERFVLFPALVFFLAASLSGLQLGLRYVLPVYPLLFIIAGRSIAISRKRIWRYAVYTLLAWYAATTFVAWPDYLSYFNEFTGRPAQGYRILRDSNIDWGQDLPALKKYMDVNNLDSIKLFYFGTADPASFGINAEALSEEEMTSPLNDVYAVSVHKLEAVKWTADKVPACTAGGSIFIYDFRTSRAKDG